MNAELKNRAFDIQYPFNILYLEGFFPNIRFFPYCWKPKYDFQEILDHYLSYFALFGKEGGGMTEKSNPFWGPNW